MYFYALSRKVNKFGKMYTVAAAASSGWLSTFRDSFKVGQNKIKVCLITGKCFYLMLYSEIASKISQSHAGKRL